MNKFYLGVIAVLIAIVILQRACAPKSQASLAKVDTAYIIRHDTVYKDKLIPSSVQSYEGDMVGVTEHDTIFLEKKIYIDTNHVDTAKLIQQAKNLLAIYNDYFSTRHYIDNYQTPYGRFSILDTITQNKHAGRGIIANWNIPVAQVPVNKVQGYIGLDIGSNGRTLGFGPTISLKTKSDQLYQAGASYIPGDIGMYYHFGISWKIKLHL